MRDLQKRVRFCSLLHAELSIIANFNLQQGANGQSRLEVRGRDGANDRHEELKVLVRFSRTKAWPGVCEHLFNLTM